MSTLFKPELVKIVQEFSSKNECLSYMAELLSTSDCLVFPDRYLAAVLAREEVMSTGIGRGIAIPHARDITVNCIQIAVCKLNLALEYNSVDDEPVSLIFMLAVPQNENHHYMQILRFLSEYLREETNRIKLKKANSEMELYHYVQEIEIIINQHLAD